MTELLSGARDAEVHAEVHALDLEAMVRTLAQEGDGSKSENAKHAAARTKEKQKSWTPGAMRTAVIPVPGLGKVTAVATDHSPDGVNPTSLCLADGTEVYASDDYGRIVRVYKPGPWVSAIRGHPLLDRRRAAAPRRAGDRPKTARK